MTEDEKAKEMIERIISTDPEDIDLLSAKILAEISVNEIMAGNPHSNPLNTEITSTMEYWINVKEKIKNYSPE